MAQQTDITLDAIKLKNLKPTKTGGNIATIEIQKECADKVLSKKFIKIGWTLCRVREIIEVSRCFKCWSFDHDARAYQSTIDRSGLCITVEKRAIWPENVKTQDSATTV